MMPTWSEYFGPALPKRPYEVRAASAAVWQQGVWQSRGSGWEGHRVGTWYIDSARERHVRGQKCMRNMLKTLKWSSCPT